MSAPAPSSPRAALVHRLASTLGFALVGIAPAERSDHAEELRAWLDAGKHGDMDYLARYADVAVDPCNVLPGAKAIICVADEYGGRDETESEISNLRFEISNQSPTGRIARYAQGDDYHRVMKSKLHQLADQLREQFPDHLFRTTVDTAPILEREHAARAGLGWIGKHTLLIHPHLGSFFFLGEILTTLPLETSADAGFPAPTVAPTDHCGSCTRCIDACPTQCITPYSIDASRCISYLTIEHRGEINAALQMKMGEWIAGCDVCQEVCPFNETGRHEGTAPEKARRHEGKSQERGLSDDASPYTSRMASLPLLDVLQWSEGDRRSAFTRSALKRIKLEQLKRNALIAAGNWLARDDDAALRSRIGMIAKNESEPLLVRQTAARVLERLAAP